MNTQQKIKRLAALTSSDVKVEYYPSIGACAVEITIKTPLGATGTIANFGEDLDAVLDQAISCATARLQSGLERKCVAYTDELERVRKLLNTDDRVL